MNLVANSFIRSVIVYRGHEQNLLLGPYAEDVAKQIEMFNILNVYRASHGRPSWEVSSVSGENLIDVLKKSYPEETLLVLPAGKSSYLDKVFSAAQVSFIKDQFLAKGGGRVYATCGTSYALSEVREYDGLNPEDPSKRELLVKKSLFPLFEGVAKGPLCPYLAGKYQVGFYSDALRVTSGEEECSIYSCGGGSFFLQKTAQKVKVLLKYLPSELARIGKCTYWENAAILTPVGKGSAVLSMLHPDYEFQDIDVDVYSEVFSDCGTDWVRVRENITPLDKRMQFVLKSVLFPLEDRLNDLSF